MGDAIYWQTLTSKQRDALVAEKVMGRKIYKEDTWGRWLLCREDQPGLTEPIPPYTTSLDAAWLAVKRFTVGVELWYIPGSTTTCRISGTVSEPTYGIAGNPAEATCIAALEAMGYKVIQ
jgi:hypothetical protein